MESRSITPPGPESAAPRSRLLLLHADVKRAGRLLQRLASAGLDVISSPLAMLDQDSLRALQPDIVLLDPPGPKAKLLQACEMVRSATGQPVVVLAPRRDDELLADVLATGVDDCLSEPAGDLELAARIDAALRRARRYEDAQGMYRVGGLVLSYADHAAELGGRRIALTPMEFRLLSCLASAPGHVLTHQALMSRVWGAEYVDSRHYLRLYIRYLREKLERDPTKPRLILSEWGVGYRLNLPRSAAPTTNPAPAPA